MGIHAFSQWTESPRLCLGKDFALTEAGYVLVKTVQTFPNIRLPEELLREGTGIERQNLTILVSSAEGCKILLR